MTPLRDAPSLQQRCAALADAMRTAFGDGGFEDASAGALRGREPDYERLKAIAQDYLVRTDPIAAGLRDLAAAVEALQRLAAVRHGPSGSEWEQIRAGLHADFEQHAAEGFVRWKRTFAAALAAWQLDFCGLLIDERFPFPARESGDIRRIRRGLRALRDAELLPAAPMVSLLIEASSDPRLSIDESVRARLLVLLGRLLVRTGGDLGRALACFDQAGKLMPKAGFTHAAMAEYCLRRGAKDRARQLCQKAIELSPAEPDGYVGVGLLCEDQKWWEESDDWYSQAVHAVWGVAPVQDTEAELGRLLAPVSGNLLLEAARMLQGEYPLPALQAVGRALTLGVKGHGTYPQRLPHRLKAEILETLGDGAGAAKSFFEAGKLYSWQGEIAAAAELFERAIKNDEDHLASYWRLADSLLLTSYSDSAPYRVDEQQLGRALEVWHRAFGKRPPEGEDGWAYLSRARMHEQQAALPNAGRRQLFWQCVTMAELSLLFSPKHVFAWSFLARLHRALGNELCALDTSARAVELDAANAGAVEERIIMLTNTGAYLDAARWIRAWRRLTRRQEPWSAAVRAHLLLCAGGRAGQARQWRALALSDEALHAGFEATWCRIDRARLYRLLGRRDLARQEYRFLWNQYEARKAKGPVWPADDSEAYGWAGLLAGMPGEAATLMMAALEDPIQDLSALDRNIGLCRLALGAPGEAEEHFARALALASRRRELDDWLRYALADIDPEADQWPEPKQANAVLSRFRERIEARKSELEEPASAVAELHKLIPALGASDAPATGLRATLARMCSEAGLFREAISVYHGLRSTSGLHVERGIEQALDRGCAAAGQQMREAHIAEAAATYQTLVEAAQSELPQDRARLASLYARTGYARLRAGESDAARRAFTSALEHYGAQAEGSAGERVANDCAALLEDAAQCWLLDDWFRQWALESPTPPVISQALVSARTALLEWLGARFRLASTETSSATEYNLVTPVAIEVGAGLVEGSGEGSPLLRSYLPEMRKRVEQATGVAIPGVRVRASELAELRNAYVLLLDDVPVVLGRISAGRRYAPYPRTRLLALGIAGPALEETAHPITGEPGFWLAQEEWDKAARKGLELWPDPQTFMVAHLEALLRQNLGDLLGLQEVQTMLEKWAGQEGGAALLDAALARSGGRLVVARLLRALVRECVPITSWREIFETLRDQDPADDEISSLAAVRLRLRNQLGGKRAPIDLPEAFEQRIGQAVVHQGRKRYLAMLPEDVQEALAEIRGLVGDAPPGSALVTRQSELRPFVRRLVELEFPHLTVLSADEVSTFATVSEPRAAEA